MIFLFRLYSVYKGTENYYLYKVVFSYPRMCTISLLLQVYFCAFQECFTEENIILKKAFNET